MQNSDPVTGMTIADLEVIFADVPQGEIGLITKEEIHLLLALRQHRNAARGDPDKAWAVVNAVNMVMHRAGKGEKL